MSTHDALPITFIVPKNDDSYGDGHWFKAVEPTVVLKIPYAVIRSAQEQYPRYDVF